MEERRPAHFCLFIIARDDVWLFTHVDKSFSFLFIHVRGDVHTNLFVRDHGELVSNYNDCDCSFLLVSDHDHVCVGLSSFVDHHACSW